MQPNTINIPANFNVNDTKSSPARLGQLDFIRGIAILVMLISNIPFYAGNSMFRLLELDISSGTAWLIQYLFIDQRFYPLFCMLFGANLCLLIEKIGISTSFIKYYLNRCLILLIIGLLHAYLLWPGDILTGYAICGMLLLLFIKASNSVLIFSGISIFILNIVFLEWPSIFNASIGSFFNLNDINYGPPPYSIEQAYNTSYLTLLEYNIWRNNFLQITGIISFRIWSALGFMLIGMVFYRLGILQGLRDKAFYKKLSICGISIGLPMVLYGIAARIGAHPLIGPAVSFQEQLPLYWFVFKLGASIMSFGYLGLFCLWYQQTNFKALKQWIAAVGQLALTNYLMHSFIFLLLFNQLQWLPFNQLDPDQLLIIVLAIWILQLTYSPIIIKYCQRGPIEALWRRCIYLPKPTELSTRRFHCHTNY